MKCPFCDVESLRLEDVYPYVDMGVKGYPLVTLYACPKCGIVTIDPEEIKVKNGGD